MRSERCSQRAVIAASLLAAVLWLGAASGCAKQGEEAAAAAKSQRSAVPVTVAPAVRKAMPVELCNFGTMQANLTVAVKSQITGILKRVHFSEGQNVKQGDLLFTIDPEPYEAALRQAEANLARDAAQQKNAEKEAARQQELLKKGVASEGEYDQARTTADALAGTLRADQAAIEQATIDLGYCSIYSPIDARTGAWMVHPGNLVTAATETILVVLNQVRPIQVSFSVLRGHLPDLQREMAGRPLEVRALIPGQEDRPEVGRLTFINNSVDSATGTIPLKATFANPDERLWPGQYVNVVLVLSVQPDAVVVPAKAVQTGQQGVYVFVVRGDQTAQVQPVVVDRTMGDEAVIAKGLEAGESVVTDGHLRLRPGAKVQVQTPSPEGETPPAPGKTAAAKGGAPRS
jgi:multidrug efflux system membrane fusion protein